MSFQLTMSSAVDAGFPEGDYRVSKAYVKVHDWRKEDGSIPANSKPAVCAFLQVTNMNDPSAVIKHPIILNIGYPEQYTILNDAGQPVPNGEEGTTLEGSNLIKSSDMFFFLSECYSCGLNDDLVVQHAGANIAKLFTGLEAHFVGKPKPKKEGAVTTADKDKKAYTTPVPTKVIRWPWEAAGAGRVSAPPAKVNGAAHVPVAGAGAVNGAVASASAPASGDAKKLATQILTAALESDSDGDIKDSLSLKKAITKGAMKAKLSAAQRGEVMALVEDPKFFDEVGSAVAIGEGFWNYTLAGESVNRAPAE